MSHRRRAELAPAEAPPQQANVIAPTAVYTMAAAAQALGLRPTAVKVAVRRGELRHATRGNRHLILGSWLLDWVRAGESERRPRSHSDDIAAG